MIGGYIAGTAVTGIISAGTAWTVATLKVKGPSWAFDATVNETSKLFADIAPTGAKTIASGIGTVCGYAAAPFVAEFSTGMWTAIAAGVGSGSTLLVGWLASGKEPAEGELTADERKELEALRKLKAEVEQAPPQKEQKTEDAVK